MPQQRNALIKRASLYPLSFDDPSNVKKTSACVTHGKPYQALSSARSYSQESSGRSLDSYEGINYLDFNYK